jgi:hypothetical protein
MASWKRMYLSKGGRVTLIKSTLANLPTYYMSLFPLPVSVANRMEKLQRDFLWGGLGDEFKYHLVSWSKVCSPVSMGGLGIRNLLMFNRALLGKWLWRYGREREAWWRIAVDSKYGSVWGGWCSLEPAGSFGVGLWKNIRKGWEKVFSLSSFQVGDGSRIRFWQDKWCGEVPLMDAFPGLYEIATMKDASVAVNLEFLGGSNHWNVSFVRAAHDWEVDVFASFFQVLYSVRVNRDCEDQMRWASSKRGLFKVKSLYCSLASLDGCRFPWKSVWKTPAPPRAAFFAWSAALGKILTLDNLRRRHVIVIDRCCMCKKAGESVDHLLLHCDVAYTVWSAFFSRFELSWVMPRRVVDLLGCWWSSGRPRSAAVWKMVPTCIFWCLWKERNDRNFEDREKSLEDILSFFYETLFLWTAAFVSPLSLSFSDFLVYFAPHS